MGADRIGGKRDRGVALWGNMVNGLFQYRAAILDGKASLDGKDNPRYSGRLHISLLDPEEGWGYNGTYLGKKKVLTFGADYDTQAKVTGSISDIGNYSAWTIDGFLEYPLNSGTPTLEGALFSFDTDGKSLKNQGDGWFIQGGWLLSQQICNHRFQPFARWEKWNSDDNSPGNDQNQWFVGLNCYIQEQSAKLTFSWTRVMFDKEKSNIPAKKDHSIITGQLQIMF